jgi:hypothetical protein
MPTDRLVSTDMASAAVQKTPNRVTLAFLESRIKEVEYIHPKGHPSMTIAVLYHKNGFVFVGKSAPADPDNFNEDLGKQYAYEDAVRQIWGFEGFLLREQLADIERFEKDLSDGNV